MKGRSELEQVTGISLFRNDIAPEWSDPENKVGSEYQLMLDDHSHENVDSFWQELVLSVIGETITHSDQVNYFFEAIGSEQC